MKKWFVKVSRDGEFTFSSKEEKAELLALAKNEEGAGLEIIVLPKYRRTPDQNSALHVFFDLLAKSLNESGLDQKKVLKEDVDIPWTKEAVKRFLWKPIQVALTGKESTRELEKFIEIDKIHSVLMKHLGEKFGVEYIEFPHDPEKIGNYLIKNQYE